MKPSEILELMTKATVKVLKNNYGYDTKELENIHTAQVAEVIANEEA